MTFRFSTVRSLAAFVVGGAAVIVSPAIQAADQAPIKIGEIVTLQGPVALSVLPIRIGYDLAVKEINEAGGIDGRRIEIFALDDQADPTIAVGVAKRLVQESKVDLILGPNISQLNLAVLPTLTEGKIASVNFSTNQPLAAAPYAFSFGIRPEATADTIVPYVTEILHAKRVAVLSDSGANSKALAAGVVPALAKRGLEMTDHQEFEYHTTDATPQLLSLRRGNPDAIIFLPGSPQDVGVIQKNLDELGWDVKIVGNNVVGTSPAAAMEKAGPNAFKSTVGVSIRGFTFCPGEPADPRAVKFVEKIKAFAPETAKLGFSAPAFAYDSVYILKAAVEATHATMGPALADWIATHASDIPAVSGKLLASPSDHFFATPALLAMVQHPERTNGAGMQERADCKS
jgi:ABC-type branched-subunit amino acid transport system substrate-binding protein